MAQIGKVGNRFRITFRALVQEEIEFIALAVAGAATAAREAGADFGLSAEEVQRIADKVPPGKSAVIVLVENLWERKFREAVGRHGGSLINQRWYGADTLARLGERLAAGRRGQEPAA